MAFRFDLDSIKEKLQDKRVRNGLLGVGVIGLLYLGTKVLFEEPKPRPVRVAPGELKKSFSSQEIENLDEGRMQSKFKSLVTELEAKGKQLDDREKQWKERVDRQAAAMEEMKDQVRRFSEEVKVIRRLTRDQGGATVNLNSSSGASSEGVSRVGAIDPKGSGLTTQGVVNGLGLQGGGEKPEPILRKGREEEPKSIRYLEKGSVKSLGSASVETIGAPEVKEERVVDRVDDLPGIFVPVGAIVSGVLLTGGDLPTSNSGRSQPFPLLYEVRGDMILPNGFSVSMEGCFVMVSGYGDVSTGRGMLRSETVSCVNKRGEAVEARMNAIAYDGKDGKVGVKGTLVSKHADLLGKTLMSSWLGGVGQALAPQRVNSIQTNAGSDDLFVTPNFGDIAMSGAMTSASDTVKKISDFYLSSAEKMQPVIEIPGKKVVNFVVSSGFSLKL